MPIYLQWDDQSITGDVTDPNYSNWIELSSFQWGIGRGITAASGSESDREGSTPTISEISLTKSQDSASPALFQASTGAGPGGTGKLVHIAFVTTGTAGSTTTYLQYDLTNTLVSGWSQSSGGDRPSESLTLNFTAVTMNVTPTGGTGTSNSPARPGYDLSKSQPTGG